MQFSTLCVARGRGASGKACDAERRTIMSCPRRPTQCFSTELRLSFRTLQRGNAVHDALRRKRTRSVQNGMTTRSVAR
ncbi:DUF1534 domain-containing protein [Pseudomonas syringae]|nr:DUF1534 domain-containing protein [Pseudomonas syringae]MCF5739254.1 DUF1534 domain-containing protein [Pseudomonas syringae]MCF5754947.1 DUF1534 domain-containing protein [Pseudomonas syringae]